LQKNNLMEPQNKNIKLVSNKKTRVILPNILTLVGVCIGLTSIKFAFDGKFELSIISNKKLSNLFDNILSILCLRFIIFKLYNTCG